jgi:uncharacterized Zn finger protein
MAVTVSDLREYLRLPSDTSEDLTAYLEAARSEVRVAGVPDYQSNAMYDMFLLMVAAERYENRSMAFSGAYQASAEETSRRMKNAFVLALRYAGEDPAGGA